MKKKVGRWHVAQMGEVYKKAVETIVWLGPEENDSDIAMEKFSAIGEEALRCGILELSHTKFDAKKWVAICVGKKQCDDERPLERLFRTSTLGSTPSVTFPLFPIQALLNRQWGTRVWVMQELVLSRNPVFVCGHKRIPADHFEGVLLLFENMYRARACALVEPWSSLLLGEVIVARGISGQCLPAFLAEVLGADLPRRDVHQPVATMLQVRRRYLQNQAIGKKTYSLLDLLIQSNRLNSTDLRDRVYGVLGLAADADAFGIRPDYNKSWQNLYVQVAKCFFKPLGPNALLFSNPETLLPGLPSWVLDFDAYDNLREKVSRLFITGMRIAPKLDFQQIGGREVLYVLGSSFDKVAILGPKLYDVEQILSMEPIKQWKKKCKWIKDVERALYPNATAYLTAQSREEAIWRTLISDREVNQGAMVRASNSGLEYYRIIQSSSAEVILDQNMLCNHLRINIQRYMGTVESVVSNHRVLVTSKGYVGLGPKQVQDGDKIVVLAGAFVPYIVRKDHGGFYRFVGEAYIHGIMDGQALTKDRKFRMFAMY
jgi:hypothetical protein